MTLRTQARSFLRNLTPHALILVWVTVGILSTSVHAETHPGCPLLLSSEEKILSRLPPQFAEFLRRNKHRKFLLMNDEDRKLFHDALDRSLQKGNNHTATENLSTVQVRVIATRLPGDRIEISFPYIGIDYADFGKTAKNHNHEFPKIMFETLNWVSKKNEQYGFKEIIFKGKQVENLPLVEILTRMGFYKASKIKASCPVYSIMGGAVGAVGGILTVVGITLASSDDPNELHDPKDLLWGGGIGIPVGVLATIGVYCTRGEKGFTRKLSIRLE